MIKLLIIADDFTGALDTGIQFVKKGIETQVMIGTELSRSPVSGTAQVLVVDSETRPMTNQEAHDVAVRIARQAVEMEVGVIYKKTDSALRGNVGSELSGVLEGTDDRRIYWLPAFPDVKRITEKGIHYIDGVRLENSGFGKDPFDPMTCSYIPDILGRQTNKKIVLVGREETIPAWSGEPEIVVFDAGDNEDIRKRIQELKKKNQLKYLSGCAGFAAFLPEALGLTGNYNEEAFRTDGFLITCGSLNPITRQQVEYAESHGFFRKNLKPQQKLCPDYYQSEQGTAFLEELAERIRKEKRVEIDTFDLEGEESTGEYAARNGINSDGIRFLISECFGKMVKHLVQKKSGYDYIDDWRGYTDGIYEGNRSQSDQSGA